MTLLPLEPVSVCKLHTLDRGLPVGPAVTRKVAPSFSRPSSVNLAKSNRLDPSVDLCSPIAVLSSCVLFCLEVDNAHRIKFSIPQNVVESGCVRLSCQIARHASDLPAVGVVKRQPSAVICGSERHGHELHCVCSFVISRAKSINLLVSTISTLSRPFLRCQTTGT